MTEVDVEADIEAFDRLTKRGGDKEKVRGRLLLALRSLDKKIDRLHKNLDKTLFADIVGDSEWIEKLGEYEHWYGVREAIRERVLA